MSLVTEDNLGAHADDMYTLLLDSVHALTPDQVNRFNARLVLILMNQVGDPAKIREAIRLAYDGINDE